jgi:glyoxylase-like metal-dependent hydrolase (beta-lactamase superfamily II)
MIHIQSFVFNPFQENTYIAYTDSGTCMIIDPGCYDSREEKTLSDYIANNGLKPSLLVNTHCHIDHVFGNAYVEKTYGLMLHIPEGEKEVLNSASRVADLYGLNYTPHDQVKFFNGDKIFLDGEVFEILEVPGHSPGHIALYNKAQGLLIGGDVLFKQSIGRTDLPGGDMDVLLKSIRNKLFVLPDETVVYPGHMETTTIGYEKLYNPFLK